MNRKHMSIDHSNQTNLDARIYALNNTDQLDLVEEEIFGEDAFEPIPLGQIAEIGTIDVDDMYTQSIETSIFLSKISMETRTEQQCETNPTSNADSTPTKIDYLPEDFRPTEFDILCEKGNQHRAYHHQGNIRLKRHVADFLQYYQSTTSRKEKGNVIKQIVKMVQEKSKDGGFVRQNKNNGRWYRVDDVTAREKVGQLFRDLVNAQKLPPRSLKRSSSLPPSRKPTRGRGESLSHRIYSNAERRSTIDSDEISRTVKKKKSEVDRSRHQSF